MFTNESAKGLMELTERLSGSSKFSAEYKKNEKKLYRITQEKQELSGKLRLIAKNHKKTKKLVENIQRSGDLIEEEIQLENEIFNLKVISMDKNTREGRKEMENMTKQIAESELKIDQLSGKIIRNKRGYRGKSKRKEDASSPNVS